MKRTILTLALIFFATTLFAQSEEEILNKWISTYNELSAAKNYDAMISNFAECHQQVPSWDFAYYYKGMAEFNKQNYQQAVKDLSSFVAKIDTVSAAYMMMAQSFNALSQPQDALDVLSKYVVKEPNDKNGYLEMANSHRLLNQYDVYIEDLKKVISLDGEDMSAYKNLASAYAMQKNYQQAIVAITKVIDKDANDVESVFNRGTFYFNLRTSEGIQNALNDFVKSEELGMKNANLYNRMYACYSMLKNNAGAIATCTKLLEINPNDFKTLYNRANTYYKDEKYKEAIADMDNVINNEKVDNGTKLNALKTRYMCKKNLKDAEGANADLELIKKMSGK